MIRERDGRQERLVGPFGVRDFQGLIAWRVTNDP
jgi:hypothetical protein